MIQLTTAIPVVEGKRYWAMLIGRRIARWEARKVPGKDFVALYPIGGRHYMPLDYFHWWTENARNFPYLGETFKIELNKEEEELQRRRDARRKR